MELSCGSMARNSIGATGGCSPPMASHANEPPLAPSFSSSRTPAFALATRSPWTRCAPSLPGGGTRAVFPPARLRVGHEVPVDALRHVAPRRVSARDFLAARHFHQTHEIELMRRIARRSQVATEPEIKCRRTGEFTRDEPADELLHRRIARQR